MPSFSGKSDYNPSVAPNTGEGLARGIASFGSSIGGAIQTYATNKRADAIRAEDREWQIDDRNAGWDHEAQVYGQRRQDAKADKAAERALEEQAMRDQVAGQAAAMAHTYGMDPRTMETLKSMSPKAQKEYLDIYGAKHATAARQQMEIDGALAKEKALAEYHAQYPPSATTLPYKADDGTILGYAGMVGGKPMAPYMPSPKSEAGLTPEQIAAYVGGGATVRQQIGGATITQKPTSPKSQGTPVLDKDGNLKFLPPGYSPPEGYQPLTPVNQDGLKINGTGIFPGR